MNKPTTSITLLITILFYLLGCSSISLQSKRLNTAESFIIEAEHILNGSPQRGRLTAANENLGTANAYLLTLKDNRKHLSENEKRRYQSLKQRANQLKKRIR
ncbi:MAG: hypothetical protein V3U71_03745 [Cocleimonas sp.]